MQQFEYKVVPAPRKGEKQRGLKTTSDRFAQTLTQLMNDLGREGWEYIRADTLPCEERVGFTGKTTTFQNLLVFRRLREPEATAATPQPALVAEPPVVYAPPAPVVHPPSNGAAPALGPAQSASAQGSPALGGARPGLAAV